MDTAAIRLQNFLTLFKKFKNDNTHLPDRGMLKLFAERLEISDRFVSHIKNGRKNIGASVARKIEQQMKLPYGWLDNPHQIKVGTSGTDPLKQDLANPDVQENQFLQTALSIYRKSPVEAQAIMLEFLKKQLEQKT